jgi:hypothetical protein
LITEGPVLVTVDPPRTAKLLAVPSPGAVAAEAIPGVASSSPTTVIAASVGARPELDRLALARNLSI